MRAQHFFIKSDIYPFDIMVSVNEQEDILIERLKKYGYRANEIEAHIKMPGMGRTILLPNNQTVIRLKTGRSKAALCGLIAHEAFHAASFILHKVGIEFDQDKSEEAFTYFLQFIVTEIHAKLKV